MNSFPNFRVKLKYVRCETFYELFVVHSLSYVTDKLAVSIPLTRDGTGSSGSRVTGSPGQHFGPGRVGSRVSVQYTWPGLLTRIRRYKNVLSVYWWAVTVSVFGSSDTGRLSTVSRAAIWCRQQLYDSTWHKATKELGSGDPLGDVIRALGPQANDLKDSCELWTFV